MAEDVGFVLATIAGIALLAGFVHSAIGFGFGIVAISLLPMVIDPRTSHVVLSVSSVPMLLVAAWSYRDGIEWKSLRQAMLGTVIFLPLGLLLFESVSLSWLVRGTGFSILLMVLWSLRNQNAGENASGSGSCFLAGATGGFLAGAVSIAGPPIAAFALRQDWSQSRFKAFVTQCLLLMSCYKAALLIWRGHFVGDALPQTAVVAAVSIIGVQLGVLASRRIPAEGFKRLVAVALAIVACMMMWRG
ncbi:MAG: sulfite exporter TauE/SafE family protein [Rubripirellula sp.]